MPPSPVEELALLDLDRSNKGASKQRRDQINAEISRMRDLLPLPETARQRLSQLQIMSLSCVYIRKCNVLHKLFRSVPAEKDVPTMCDFFQALTGFLLITTREGKLVYISENVTDYLGHSMVDMKTQGDSLYDIVDKRDHGTVQAQLLQGGAELDVTRDVAFFCRMNMSRTLKRQAGFGDVKVMHVRGHFIPLSDPDMEGSDQQQQQQQKYVFMATCSPLITPELKENLVQSNTMVFKTVHQLDMTFMEVTKTAEYHLGYTTDEISQKSWYSMLHPEDIHEAREKHILLIRSSHEMGCMMTVRMLSAEGQVLWVNIVMHVRQAASAQNDDPLIVCINQVISEEEAYQIRMQSHMFTLYPPRSTDMWAAGLNPTGLPQQSQPDSGARWIPSSTMVAPTAHSSGYQAPVGSYCLPDQQHHALSTCAVNYTAMHDSKAYQANHTATPAPGMPLPHGQTDKLKLMLKRKIQGPCRPAKVPKLSWQESQEGSSSSSSGQSFEYAATADPMHSPDSASQCVSGGHSGGYSWPASTQVVPRAQYRVAHVLPVTLQHPVNVKANLFASHCPSALSPPLSMSSMSQVTEQVVPDSSVAVPESYLTPDPSPASSPQPHTSGIKTEAVETKAVPTSAAILQQLEKLAAFNSTKTAPVPPAASVPAPLQIKKEKTNATQCRQSSCQRELPIMDAFDIESFFDTLNCGKAFPADSRKEEQSVSPKTSGPASAPTEAAAAQTKPIQVIKQEPVDPDSEVNPQQQVPGLQQTPAQQSEMDPMELEELLSFFSGDLTATQMDLSDALLTSSSLREDTEVLAHPHKAFANSSAADGMLCNADHLSHFLLHTDRLERPLEEFSPVSSSSMASDAYSELSGDEESGSEEPLDRVLLPATGPSSLPQRMKDGGERRRTTPPHGTPSPAPTQPHTPPDQPGISEEDELYQLDKLLSSMASDNGMVLSGEPQ